MDKGKLDPLHEKAIENCTKAVSDQLAQKYDNIRKGVDDIMVGPILDLEIFRIHDEGVEEGIAENRISTARSLLASGVSDDIIINCTGISPAEFEKIKAETKNN